MNKYYEIWFYYYGENDERNDMENEFTFYIKIDRQIKSTDDMKKVLNERINSTNEAEAKEYKYWLDGHLDNVSKWFEISGEEFTDGCGIPS